MTKLSDADEAILAKVSHFQRENARKELEAKYAKKEKLPLKNNDPNYQAHPIRLLEVGFS